MNGKMPEGMPHHSLPFVPHPQLGHGLHGEDHHQASTACMCRVTEVFMLSLTNANLGSFHLHFASEREILYAAADAAAADAVNR